MTVTFIGFVYGVSCRETDFNFINEEGDPIDYIEYTGLSEDDKGEFQVYLICEDFLSKEGKDLIQIFEAKYDLPFCIDASLLKGEMLDKPAQYWIQEDVYKELIRQGVPTHKFKWQYVVEQW